MTCIVCSAGTLTSPSPVQRAEITQRRISVGGRPTIVHELAATAACRLQIGVVPGNPGMSGFYLPFMRALHDGLGGAVTLSAITHVGLGGLTHGQLFGLEEQVEHKRQWLEEHLLRPGSPPCALIGHSIGAYMALRAARSVEQSLPDAGASAGHSIVKVIGLFPFLAGSPENTEQQRLTLLTRWPFAMALISALVGILPPKLTKSVVTAWAGSVDEHAMNTALELLTLNNARNCFHLGQTEFDSLRSDMTEACDLLQHFGSRAAVLSKENDSWFTDAHRQEMTVRVPAVTVGLDKRQSHAFCVSTQLSDLMAADALALLSSESFSAGSRDQSRGTRIII